MPTFPLIVDKSVEYPNRFAVTDVSEGVIDLTPEPGAGELGTELNTGLFNGIKQYVDESSNIICVATRVSNAVYTVTDPRTPSPIPVGYTCTIVPDKTSASNKPTLNINEEGAFPLRPGRSGDTGANTVDLPTAGTITANTPVSVTYLGTAWRINDLSRLDLTANDIVGPLPPNKGGTGQSLFTKGDLLYAKTPDTLVRLSAGNLGQKLSIDADGVPVWVDDPVTYSAGNWEWSVDGNNMCTATGVVPLGALTFENGSAPVYWTKTLNFGVPANIFGSTPKLLGLKHIGGSALTHAATLSIGVTSLEACILRFGTATSLSASTLYIHLRGTYGGRTA